MIEKLVMQESEVVSEIEIKYNGDLDKPTFIMMTENDNKCVIALTIEQTIKLANKLNELVILATEKGL